MTDKEITLHTINKSFGTKKKKQHILHNISLDVNKGDVYGFLGPNGAGKSTTIKLLLNFFDPDSGTMSILGNTIGKNEFRHLIGYLPESPIFYEHLTAHETLLLSGRLSNVSSKRLTENIPRLLKRMNLSDAASQRITGFSKGMKQRLGMANALIHDPEVLIFDEPMSGLDPLGRRLIKDIILELKALGKTVFFSSHILGDIEELCNRIGIIHKGHILYSGELADFLIKDKSLEECFVDRIKEVDHAGIA